METLPPDYFGSSLMAFMCRVESRLIALEARMDRHFGTCFLGLRADMQRHTETLVRWIVGTAIAQLVVAGVVMAFVLNSLATQAPVAVALPQPLVVIQILPPPAPVALPQK
ncbi:MAG: hypothetical protein V4462_00260 [Pseudomonadota bacterium]